MLKTEFGVWGFIFAVSFIHGVAQKLRRIVLLHFGLRSKCSMSRWGNEIQKTIGSTMLGFLDVSMTPNNNYLSALETQNYFKQFRKIPQTLSGKFYFWTSQHLGSLKILEMLKQTWTDHRGDPYNNFWRS